MAIARNKRRSLAAFLAGQAARGYGYRFEYDSEANGPFIVGEELAFTNPIASAVLQQLVDNGNTGVMRIAAPRSGKVPVVSSGITGRTSGATANVKTNPSMEVDPFSDSFIQPAPGVATDPYWNNVVLLLGADDQANGSVVFTDESSYARTGINRTGSVAVSTEQSIFSSGSSIKFNGNNMILYAPDSNDFEFGANHFTLECWVYNITLTGVGTGAVYMGKYKAPSNHHWLFDYNNGNLRFICWQNLSGTPGTTLQTAWTRPVGSWHHLAADYDGAKMRMYVDGVNVANVAHTGGSATGGTQRVHFGNYDSVTSASGINGYMDEIRITNGVARYATDGSFSVPTEKFPRG